MTYQPAADRSGYAALEQRVTLGAIALCVVYSVTVVAAASPASFYTLDDPYIHMALAENIARGTFGVNLGEVSNPSSSIVWPWIMAAFEKAGLMLWAPLLINIACFVMSVRVILAFSLKRLAPDGKGVAPALILLGLGFLAFNLFGVIFTGMEHGLHTLLSILAVTRVIDGRYDRLALASLVLSPLVRFEGAIVLALGVGAAIVDRKWWFAAAAAGAAAALVGLYALWLTGLGLPVLPSSVLAKSAVSSELVDGGRGAASGLLANFVTNLGSPVAPMMGVLGVAMAFAAVKRQARDRILALGMIAALLLAMILGRTDSYARYNVFIMCVAGLAAIHLLGDEIRAVLTSPARAVLLGAGLCFATASLGPYTFVTTPLAARNIDRQQHQMHRFLAECWQRPVAINDLGWTSFRNDDYVLDLYGLGSEEARLARVAGQPGWMKRLVDRAGVEAVMIYKVWFPDIPEAWVPVGTLVLDGARITPGASDVEIYATRREVAPQVKACVQQLKTSLPDGATLVIPPSR